MPFRSAEYQRGYDAGYKQALLEAVRQPRFGGEPPNIVEIRRRERAHRQKASRL